MPSMHERSGFESIDKSLDALSFSEKQTKNLLQFRSENIYYAISEELLDFYAINIINK